MKRYKPFFYKFERLRESVSERNRLKSVIEKTIKDYFISNNLSEDEVDEMRDLPDGLKDKVNDIVHSSKYYKIVLEGDYTSSDEEWISVIYDDINKYILTKYRSTPLVYGGRGHSAWLPSIGDLVNIVDSFLYEIYISVDDFSYELRVFDSKEFFDNVKARVDVEVKAQLDEIKRWDSWVKKVKKEVENAFRKGSGFKLDSYTAYTGSTYFTVTSDDTDGRFKIDPLSPFKLRIADHPSKEWRVSAGFEEDTDYYIFAPWFDLDEFLDKEVGDWTQAPKERKEFEDGYELIEDNIVDSVSEFVKIVKKTNSI